MELNPSTSIVIPAYNAEKTIGKTLKACLEQDYPGRREIIVVDDGSTDGTKKEVERWPVRCIHQENRGPASARNRGWREAKGEIVCFTDSDCIPNRDWLSKLLRNYQDDQIGAVGGSYEIANKNSFLASCIQEEITLRHLRMPRFVRFLGSYNLSGRKSVLEITGGFREDYRKASGEDNDLSYRILKQGYKIAFDREALVAHYHRESLWRYLKDQYTHGFWRAKLYIEHPDMSRGDDYTGLKDVLEIPLCLGLLLSGPICWTSSLWSIALIVLWLLQLEMAFKIALRNKNPLYLSFAFITFFRCFSRSLGFLKGAVVSVTAYVKKTLGF
jgi:glycosyltransferase involved in cell wall biosynthesis